MFRHSLGEQDRVLHGGSATLKRGHVKGTSVFVSLVCLSSALAGQAPRSAGPTVVSAEKLVSGFHFADIGWGAGADSVKAALSRQNLSYLATDSLGDLTFTGNIIDRKAAVVASMHDGHVVRIVIGFAKTPGSTLLLYRTVKRELVSKYGPPATNTEVFAPPAYYGDGKEEQALATGKAAFLSQWRANTGEKLSLVIDERPAVMLFYQSAEWPAEEARRTKAVAPGPNE
jgi:hypothetical protein